MVKIRKSHIDELKIFSTLDKQKDVEKYVTQKSLDEHINEFCNPDMLYLTIINKYKKIAGYFIVVREDKKRVLKSEESLLTKMKEGLGNWQYGKWRSFAK